MDALGGERSQDGKGVTDIELMVQVSHGYFRPSRYLTACSAASRIGLHPRFLLNECYPTPVTRRT